MYMVILKGPGIDEDGKFGNQADFGWEITLNGRCAAGLVPNNEGLTAIERGLCECDKGMEPIGSRPGSSSWSTPAPIPPREAAQTQTRQRTNV